MYINNLERRNRIVILEDELEVIRSSVDGHSDMKDPVDDLSSFKTKRMKKRIYRQLT